jgi:lauroyl/myristoyl acyltransferase
MKGLKAGGSSNHRWYFFHLAGLCFATAMRLVPYRSRFGAAILIARALVPFISRTQAFREQRKGNVDSAREIACHFILNTLTKNGIEFAPVMIVEGYENLERAMAEGKGVLGISPHTALSLLLVRFFHDAGLDPIVIAADPEMRISGTTLTAQTLLPSQTFLVTTRSKLREGKLVLGMPDRAEPHEGRTVDFDTANGRIIIATALIQVAARCGANVIFLKVQAEKRGIVATVASPAQASVGSRDALTEDFIEFVRAHVAARAPLAGEHASQ